MMEENENPEAQNPEGSFSQNNLETEAERDQENASEIIETALDENPLNDELKNLGEKLTDVKTELKKLIVGQEELIDFLLLSVLCGGHALVEGVPGIAKTLTTKLIAQALDVEFSRIQFTPDLMPADVVGTNVFNMKASEFSFKKGPVFSNVVLIDEINRAPAKTQSALFEVMEEVQVTVDGTTYKMDEPYFVLATQNPLEQEGTYKLPEAQLDRFLFRILIDYPNLEEEIAILNKFKNDFTQEQKKDVKPVLTSADIMAFRTLVEKIKIEDGLIHYIGKVVLETRNNPNLYLGASPRASLAILKAAKANAALNQRYFVTPDDVKRVAFPVLNHRIMLSPEREMEGYDSKQVITEILNKIDVPR